LYRNEAFIFRHSWRSRVYCRALLAVVWACWIHTVITADWHFMKFYTVCLIETCATRRGDSNTSWCILCTSNYPVVVITPKYLEFSQLFYFIFSEKETLINISQPVCIIKDNLLPILNRVILKTVGHLNRKLCDDGV
jgi:hypothetical protein